MSDTVQRAQSDGVLVLRLDRPLANALVPEMRAALVAALAEAGAAGQETGQQTCRAVVIAGAGAGFSSGLDLTEYETGPQAPGIGDLCRAVAGCARPVVAALHGEVAGAGLSLALAAQGRVAHQGARLVCPEIALGRIPCGGATQRLPRIVGAQAALEMMLSGRPVTPTEPRLRPLFDRIVTDEAALEAAAVELAARLADTPPDPARRDPQRGLSDPRGYQRAIATVRARLERDDGAAADILRAVEAAQLLPLPQGLDFEEVLEDERARSREARALCHLRLAGGRARALPETRSAQGHPVARVGLAGPVPGPLSEWLSGRLTAAGVTPGGDEPADPADLWIEATPGAAPDRSAGVTLDAGAGFGREGLWLRLYPEADMAEIGVGPGAAPGTVAALARLLARARLGVVRTALPVAGPGAGRMLQGALDLAALALVQAGSGPADVDRGAEALGLGAGPCLGMDDEGLDVAQARLTALAAQFGMPPPAPDGPLAARIARGARGRAVGRGFYEYPPEGPRAPRGKAGGALPGAAGTTGALHAALVNAAERLLASGALARPGDVDLLAVAALGMARDRGGPLFAADDRGLLAVLRDMKALAPLSGPLWAPQPGLEARVREGQGYFGRAGAVAISRA